jgi:hypothetical protein
MGVVIPFPRKIAASLPLEELALLDRLRGSFQVSWQDGWAAPGRPRGVVLLKRGHCLGAWCHDEGGFTYWPVGAGEPVVQVWTVEAAHQHTLVLLRLDEAPDSIA